MLVVTQLGKGWCDNALWNGIVEEFSYTSRVVEVYLSSEEAGLYWVCVRKWTYVREQIGEVFRVLDAKGRSSAAAFASIPFE